MMIVSVRVMRAIKTGGDREIDSLSGPVRQTDDLIGVETLREGPGAELIRATEGMDDVKSQPTLTLETTAALQKCPSPMGPMLESMK